MRSSTPAAQSAKNRNHDDHKHYNDIETQTPQHQPHAKR